MKIIVIIFDTNCEIITRVVYVSNIPIPRSIPINIKFIN